VPISSEYAIVMQSRNATVALVLSAIFPGFGQFYNHDYAKGTAFLVCGVALGWFGSETLPSLDSVIAGKVPEGLGPLLTIMVLYLVCYGFSMVDAYRSANSGE
jgi:hypothetical protein